MALRGLGSRFSIVLVSIFFSASAFADLVCGDSPKEKAKKGVAWGSVLNVHFLPDSGDDITGLLCAGWGEKSGYSIDYFSFKTDADFAEIYPVQAQGNRPGLTTKSETMFANEDVSKVSPLAGIAMRAGSILTLGLSKIESNKEKGETAYRLKLRFPEQISRNFVYSQPNGYHEMSVTVVRPHGKEYAWGYVEDLGKLACSRVTIEINTQDIEIDRLLVRAAGKEHTLYPKDFPVKKGGHFRPSTKELETVVQALAASDRQFEIDKAEARRKTRLTDSPEFGQFAEVWLP